MRANFQIATLLISLVGVMSSDVVFAQAERPPLVKKTAEATPDTVSPTMLDMVKWKSDVLSKYDDITYLDADSKNLTEEIFFSRVVAEKRGFNMHTDPAAPKRIIIRLLSDAEQASAQASAK